MNELIAVDNRELRVYRLMRTTPLPPREPGEPRVRTLPSTHQRLVPGINFVQDELRTEALHLSAHTKGRVRIVDVLSLEHFEAVDLAQRSAHPHALERWLDAEERPPVRAAIEARLAEMRKGPLQARAV